MPKVLTKLHVKQTKIYEHNKIKHEIVSNEGVRQGKDVPWRIPCHIHVALHLFQQRKTGMFHWTGKQACYKIKLGRLLTIQGHNTTLALHKIQSPKTHKI